MGHLLRIYDAIGNEVGYVKEKVFTWLPKFEIYRGNHYVGCIRKEFSFLKPQFNIDYNGWRMDGNWLEWDYTIQNSFGMIVATVARVKRRLLKR